jgi:pimeloyl-ACP methyl ester carboxylesterase
LLQIIQTNVNEKVTTKTFTYQSSLISYQIIGTGKPVLLLHGFGEDSSVWQNQIGVLKNNYQLIIPDLPGSGQSQLIDDMSIVGMADCIKELIITQTSKFPLLEHSDNFGKGAEGVAIFGHSMGGYIILALVEKYPALFSSFGLIHSTAFADNEEKKAARKKSIEFIYANGANEFLKTTIPNLFYTINVNGNSNPYINILIKQGKNFTNAALVAYYNAMINRLDRTNVLKTFPNPILFIIGEHDLAIPFNQSMQQCHLPQQAHVHILRNTAHMGMWEEIEKTNNAMLSFLSTI